MRKFALLLSIVFCFSMLAQKKQNLKVLYVGGTSNYELMGVELKPDSVELERSTQERMKSFDTLLRRYFKKVKTVRNTDWTPELSKQYDVTVFDALPNAVSPRDYVRDEHGRVVEVIYAKYLPEDFDMPAVTVAEIGENLGRTLGLKSDWYCLCLDLEAHHWKKDHAVFAGPYKVNPPTYMAPTPAAAKEVAKAFSEQLPEQTEMWRVVKQDWAGNKGKFYYRIGMVSRPDGFGDPDDEVISSGVCAKSIDAVAIGRHGNFLHWGFAGSPDYFTPEAQNLFANCIVYISKFKGQRPIARKFNEGIDTRHWLGSKKTLLSREGYKDFARSNEVFYAQMDSMHNVAVEKKARGEELTAAEAYYLDAPTEHPKTPSYHDYLSSREKGLYDLFGDNTQLYLDYYNYNKPYFYTDGKYDLLIDKEAREWGIANNDIQILEHAVSLLEKGDARDQLMARQVLKRYTLCRFAEAKEWREWFDKYRDKLFFSAAGGYLWLANEQNAPCNDYSVLAKEKPAPKAAQKKELTSKQDPVHLGGACYSGTLYIELTIHPGFHIYADVKNDEPFIPTKISFELPETMALDGNLISPATRVLDEGGTTVYEGEATFRQNVVGKGKVKVTVSYQCCDDNGCQAPTEKTIEIEVK